MGKSGNVDFFPITHAIEPLYSNSAVVAGWLQSTRAQNTDTAPGLCNKDDYVVKKRTKGIFIYVLEFMLTLDTHDFVYRVFWLSDWVIDCYILLEIRP